MSPKNPEMRFSIIAKAPSKNGVGFMIQRYAMTMMRKFGRAIIPHRCFIIYQQLGEITGGASA